MESILPDFEESAVIHNEAFPSTWTCQCLNDSFFSLLKVVYILWYYFWFNGWHLKYLSTLLRQAVIVFSATLLFLNLSFWSWVNRVRRLSAKIALAMSSGYYWWLVRHHMVAASLRITWILLGQIFNWCLLSGAHEGPVPKPIICIIKWMMIQNVTWSTEELS